MKVLADENVDWPIVEQLRKNGHTVLYVAEAAPGTADEAVFKLANQEQAILLTADKGFGEMVFRQHKVLRGAILIRLSGVPPHEKARIVVAALTQHGAQMIHAFTVITPKSIRIRPWRHV